jgi:hypothetical protein
MSQEARSAATKRKVGRLDLAAVVKVDAGHDVEYHLELIRAHFLNRFSCYVHEFYPNAVIVSNVDSRHDLEEPSRV